MSIPKEPKVVKLIMSTLYANASFYEKARFQLKEKFGDVDCIKEHFPFTFTSYYQKEMGEPLLRSFFSFKKLMVREMLVDVKIFTNEIENSLAKEGGQRTINIDPGYINDAQLVLATGKNFSHRIYLGKGIFGDLTLFFKQDRFCPLPWTYPDYQKEPIHSLLLQMRQAYVREIYEKQT